MELGPGERSPRRHPLQRCPRLCVCCVFLLCSRSPLFYPCPARELRPAVRTCPSVSGIRKETPRGVFRCWGLVRL